MVQDSKGLAVVFVGNTTSTAVVVNQPPTSPKGSFEQGLQTRFKVLDDQYPKGLGPSDELRNDRSELGGVPLICFEEDPSVDDLSGVILDVLTWPSNQNSWKPFALGSPNRHDLVEDLSYLHLEGVVDEAFGGNVTQKGFRAHGGLP